MAFSTGASRWIRKARKCRLSQTVKNVADIIEALAAAAIVPTKTEGSVLARNTPQRDPADVIACRNGLLNLETFELLPHSPAFFNLNSLEFAFDPWAALPLKWLEFLETLWGDDAESIACLQEFFRNLPDNRHDTPKSLPAGRTEAFRQGYDRPYLDVPGRTRQRGFANPR